MSTTSTTQSQSQSPSSTAGSDDAERRARASIAVGRERGYYRVLFDAGPVDAATFAALTGLPVADARAWLDVQLGARVLRAAESAAPDELLLPGEYVPILLGDHGEAELDGARALLDAHRSELPSVLDGWEPLPPGSAPIPVARPIHRRASFVFID